MGARVWARVLGLTLVAVLAGFWPLWGQVTTGTISGYVLDPSGKPIPRAPVAASDTLRGIARQTITDDTGLYRFADLAPGDYQVSASAPGFDTGRLAATLRVDARLRLDVSLSIAGITHRVDVTARLETVQTESSELGTVIDQRRIQALPLNRRDFLQLSLLVPGVQPPVQGSELSARSGFAMHANGGREESNNFLLDGVDNNDPYVNRYVVQPPIDSIQEFKIATNSYGAEYGRSAAGQVNVVTRGGTNAFSMLAYEYLRDRAFDARNYFDGADKPAFNRNQFGFGAGGPLVRNRTFVFASLDFLRERRGLSRLATVPTLAVRGGDLSSLGQTIVDPFTGQPFPGNIIPPERISPIAVKMLGLFPAPNAPGSAGNYLNNAVLQDHETQMQVRLDHRLTAADQFTARYSYGLTNAYEPYAEDTESAPGFGDVLRDGAHNLMLQHQRILGPRAVNSLRFGFNRFNRNLLPENFATDVGKLWGVNWLDLPSVDFGFPIVNVAGYSKLGDAFSLPIMRQASTYQVIEALTLTRASHLVQIGGEIRHQRLNGRLDMLTRGSLSFSGAISGSGLSDLLLGFPSFGLQAISDNPLALRTTAYGAYVQDDWKLRPNVTVNLGVRYEYSTPPVDATNHMSTIDLQTGAIVPVGSNGVSRSGISPDWNNVAPRVGLAWKVGREFVVRAGYGIYYAPGMLEVNSSQYYNPPQYILRAFFPTEYSLLTLDDPFPTTGGYVPPASISALAPDLVSPFMQHWNVTVERQVGRIGSVSVSYAASRGSHLIRPRDLNQARPGPEDVQDRRPYPQYGSIFFVESAGRSTYDSLQVSFSRPLSHGVAVSAAYTYSRTLDDASAFLGTTGDTNFPQDSQNMAAQFGRSSFDYPHRFSTSFSVQLPSGNAVTRNTELRGIVTVQSGQTFTPILRFDNSNTGNTGQQSGSDHPNLEGNPALSSPTAAQWFNVAAFAVPPPYTFGNAGRNILRGPAFASVDLSLARRIPLKSRTALWFEAQVFNLLNRTNFDLPELYVDEPATFGRIFSAKAPRQVQFAVRLSF
jgi:outer membrane receptor protein involved in Fe transport